MPQTTDDEKFFGEQGLYMPGMFMATTDDEEYINVRNVSTEDEIWLPNTDTDDLGHVSSASSLYSPKPPKTPPPKNKWEQSANSVPLQTTPANSVSASNKAPTAAAPPPPRPPPRTLETVPERTSTADQSIDESPVAPPRSAVSNNTANKTADPEPQLPVSESATATKSPPKTSAAPEEDHRHGGTTAELDQPDPRRRFLTEDWVPDTPAQPTLSRVPTLAEPIRQRIDTADLVPDTP